MVESCAKLLLRAETFKVRNKPCQSQPSRGRICYQFNSGNVVTNPLPLQTLFFTMQVNHPKFKCLYVSRVNIQNLPTPVNATKLHNYLLGYDSNKLHISLRGFWKISSFRVYSPPPPFSSISKNHKVQLPLHQSWRFFS